MAKGGWGDFRIIVFCALLLAVSFFAGCAEHITQVRDKGIKVKVEDGAKVSKIAKKPGEKLYVDENGEYELISTPFGYVKRRIKHAKRELEPPIPAHPEPIVSLTPEARIPAAAPIVRAEPAPPAPAPRESPKEKNIPEETGHITIDFDDADLYEVIRTIADLLNINYIVDPDVRGKVTIHTAGGLRKKDLFPLFYQILEINGLTAVKEGNLYRILKLKEASRMPIASRFGREVKDISPEERIIIQIIPLEFISAQEMTKVITPFISADGTIISHGGSNTLLVVDKGINILKILKLVEGFDVSVFKKTGYRFYPLENMDAEEAAKVLKEALSPYTGSRKDDVKLIPLERLNTLLIISSNAEVFDRSDALIHQMDISGEAAEPKIYVYFVKNGAASELGDLLNSIFGSGGETKKAAGKERVPTNPFARSLKEKKEKEVVKKAVTAGEAVPSATLREEIKVTTDEIRNALIIEAIPEDYQIVEKILDRLDVLPRQVLIEVTIAEISLGEGTDLGIEWTFNKDELHDTGSLSANIGASGLQYLVGLSEKWLSALHAFANDSKVNILSSPNVLASDNKEAKIDVTTEIPIASTDYHYTESDVLETNVEYRDTGVILSVTPHINEYGLVTMDVSQEVSELGELMKAGGKDYHSFNKRKIETCLTVKHNQTIVIGGLIKSRRSDSASGVPWLVNIPILRWFFGTETKDISKTELIVMITPHVITSLEDVDAVSKEFKARVENVMRMVR